MIFTPFQVNAIFTAIYVLWTQVCYHAISGDIKAGDKFK